MTMRIVMLFILLCALVMFSCNKPEQKERPFTTFEFYHDNTWTTAFSIRFTQSDTVYIRQHFAAMLKSGKDTTPKSNTSYIGKLPDEENRTLDRLIRNIAFSKYETSYEHCCVEDGSTFLFFIQKDSVSKVIHVYGDSAPEELQQLGRWIADVKASLKLNEVDSLITFQHANDRLPPPVNIDIRKFTPPDVEP